MRGQRSFRDSTPHRWKHWVCLHSVDLNSFCSLRVHIQLNYSFLVIYLKWQCAFLRLGMWGQHLPCRWIIHRLFVNFFMQCTVKATCILCTHPMRQHLSLLQYTHTNSRTLVRIHTPTRVHNNTNTFFHVLFCSLVNPPWFQFISECQLFGSQPSLIMQILLHHASSAVYRDLFALLSIWKLSSRKSSLFQSTPLWQIIIKPEFRSLRVYAEKIRHTIRTMKGCILGADGYITTEYSLEANKEHKQGVFLVRWIDVQYMA